MLTDTPTQPAEDMGEFMRLQYENSRLRLALAMAEGVPQPSTVDTDGDDAA